MHFFLCFIAWLCFGSGAISLIGEAYKYTFPKDSPLTLEDSLLSVFSWMWSALMLAIWFSILF